jgi:uncharacterized membrane protein
MGTGTVTYIAAYACALFVFGVIDAAWLGTMGPILYRPLLGDILAPTLRMIPAIAFYLLYPLGVVVFAVLPGLRGDSAITALWHGLLFGVIAYGTYDLTNHATLRVWSLQITLADMAYGAVASGLAAVAAFYAVRLVVNWAS